MDSRPAKKRLSMACNTCRIRKVKCDTDYPRCRNCRLRDEECVTNDPRRPGESVVREWIESERIVKGAPKSGLYGSPSSQQQTIDKQGPTIVAERPEVLFPVQEHGYEARPRSNQPIDSNLHDSPVHQPFHVSLNTDTEHNRIKIVGGSSSQCLAKSLDVYLKAVHHKPISGFFRYGMRHAEELDIPLGTSLPQLPNALLRKEYISTFLERIHSVYPLFDEDTLRLMVDQLGELKDGIGSISRDQTPWLASVYLALSIGTDEKARETTIDGTRYLQAAASLLGHVVLVPYFSAVQSLLMYTIVYRGRNQEGLAWQTLGMAIRIAYTIGMHRRAAYSAPRAEDTPYVKKYTLEGRVWAVCCILEKCMQFESGRPSAIPYSITSDDILPPHIHRHHSYGDLLQWQLELAVYQDQISEHIYGHTLRKRAAREILLDTARLDKCLLEWVNQIPSQIRPGNDIFCPRETFHCAALLSILYHEAMITLHRAAVIAPNVNFEVEVEKHGPDDASRFRILGGESICINSARAIAKLNIELSDLKTNTRLLTTGVPLLACIVLAIYLIKHPESRMQSSDLQLLKTCLELCTDRFMECNQDLRFIEGLSLIYERVSSHINSSKGISANAPAQNRASLATAQLLDRRNWTDKRINTSTGDRLFSSTNQQNIFPASPVATSVNSNELYNAMGARRSSSRRTHQAFENVTPHTPTQPHYDSTDAAVNSEHVYLRSDVEDIQWQQQTNQEEAQFPFDGYNVEDLWDWLLYFDTTNEEVLDSGG